MIRTKQASLLGHDKAAVPVVQGPSKIATVLDQLQTDYGATLEELVAATGWQPHTARAALSGLKKKGHRLEREKVDGISRYRITKVSG